MKTCTYKDCDSVHKAKGYCVLHYDRLRYTGTPEPNKDAIGRMQKRNNHPLVPTYKNVYQRCMNPNSPQYCDYGGRGITMCDRWLGIDGFNNFVKDMGNKPSEEHSIERIDNDKGYEPSNCIWATRLQQNNNQRIRKDNTSGYKGVYWNKKSGKWEARRSINRKEYCLGFFDNKEDAIQARNNFETKGATI